jgi:hypothetical protein
MKSYSVVSKNRISYDSLEKLLKSSRHTELEQRWKQQKDVIFEVVVLLLNKQF